jgi:hypothetical protein
MEETAMYHLPLDDNPLSGERMKRIFDGDFKMLFLGSMSLACAESEKVG